MPKPVLQSLVLADQIYQDAATGKKIICGTIGTLVTNEIPAKYEQRTFLYVMLVDVKAGTRLQLRYVDLSDNEVLLRRNMTITEADPLTSCELIVDVPPLPMPHAGLFALELLHEDEILGSLCIRIVLVPQ